VVVAHHVADNLGALSSGLVRGKAALVHAPEDAAVDGLQPVPRAGDGAADDDAHRIVEEALLHLGDYAPWEDLLLKFDPVVLLHQFSFSLSRLTAEHNYGSELPPRELLLEKR
jgi:hypothetical protein